MVKRLVLIWDSSVLFCTVTDDPIQITLGHLYRLHEKATVIEMQEYLSSTAKCTKQERDFLKVRKYINVLNANQDS